MTRDEVRTRVAVKLRLLSDYGEEHRRVFGQPPSYWDQGYCSALQWVIDLIDQEPSTTTKPST
jgi:hypothetical protein